MSQELLEPAVLSPSGAEADALGEDLPLINSLGFGLEPYGPRTYILRSVPGGMCRRGGRSRTGRAGLGARELAPPGKNRRKGRAAQNGGLQGRNQSRAQLRTGGAAAPGGSRLLRDRALLPPRPPCLLDAQPERPGQAVQAHRLIPSNHETVSVSIIAEKARFM